MPEPKTTNLDGSQGLPSPGQSNAWDNPPGADLDWDQLFAAPAEPTTPAEPTADDVNPDGPQAQPAPDEFFIEGEQSRYKTAEETVTGLNEKDRVIAQLREEASARTGVDPLSGQPDPNAPQAPVNFLEDSDAYLKALAEAAQAGNSQAYLGANLQLIGEVLGPYAPLLQEAAKSRAVETMRATNPDFGEFVVGEDYSSTLAEAPVLAEAITAAEADPRLAGSLPDLYKLAYLANAGRKAPDVIQAEVAKAKAEQAPVPVTQQPSTPTPVVSTSADGQPSRQDQLDALLRKVGDIPF